MESQVNPTQEIPQSEVTDQFMEWFYRIGALRAALELQLWEKIAAGEETAEKMADQEGWDPTGTRVLLDYRLRQAGIDPCAIQGYERQEFTHLAVAAAVASGAADCGLGILAAARALDQDFVPLDHERYDLVIPAQFFESEMAS